MTWVGEPALSYNLKVESDGTLRILLKGLSSDLRRSMQEKKALEALAAIHEYYTLRRKEFFTECDISQDKDEIQFSIALAPLRVSPAVIPLEVVDLSGLTLPPLLNDEARYITLPWTPRRDVKPLLITAPDEVWQNPRDRDGLLAIAKAAAIIGGSQHRIEEVSIKPHPWLKGSKGKDFFKNKHFSVVLYSRTKCGEHPKPFGGDRNEPLFFVPRSFIALPPFFCYSNEIIAAASSLVAAGTDFRVDLSSRFLSSLNTAIRRRYFADVLKGATKKCLRHGSGVQVVIDELIAPRPRWPGAHPCKPNEKGKQDPFKVLLCGVQCFDSNGKRLSLHAVKPKGELVPISQNYAEWCEAYNLAIAALAPVTPGMSVLQISAAFSSNCLASSSRMIASLRAQLRRGSSYEIFRTLADQFLHPSFRVELQQREIPDIDPSTPLQRARCFNLGFPGEVVRFVAEDTISER